MKTEFSSLDLILSLWLLTMFGAFLGSASALLGI